MKLYVLRHGHSPNIGEAGVASDAERPLSERGKEDVQKMAQLLAEQGAAPPIILTSPLLRARETARAAAGVLHPAQGVRVFQPLSNMIPGRELYEKVQEELSGVTEVLLVGHQPQLGDMVSVIAGKSVELRPGGIVAMETKALDRATVLWSRNP